VTGHVEETRVDTSTRQDVGLLALRLGVGGTLAAHGTQKLFGWFGGHGLEATTGAMRAMGFNPPGASAFLAGLGETAGGLALALGFATPVGGAATAATMVAAGAVHRPAGFFATEGGFEYTGVLGLVGTALAITGPGRFSLDHALGDRFNRPWMAAAALAGLGTAALVVVGRRSRELTSAAPTAADQPAEGEHAEARGA
jgi:putative oxidoreductase